MDIGTRLKEAREAQNISLDTLQETTKIQKRYLQAIEQGNFHLLPGKFYARAFIKEYAIAVGLNPDELLEGHKDEVPSTEESEPTVQYSRLQRSRRESGPSKVSSSFSFIPTLIVVLLVIGIIFVAWGLYQKAISDKSTDPVETGDDEIIRDSNERTNQAEDDEVTDVDEDEQNETGDEQEEESDGEDTTFDVLETGSGSSPESSIAVHTNDERVLTFESSGETYLEVKDENGSVLFSGILNTDNSPEEITIEEDKVYLNIGYAPDLTVSVNGTDLPYPIEPDEKYHQKLWLNFETP